MFYAMRSLRPYLAALVALPVGPLPQLPLPVDVGKTVSGVAGSLDVPLTEVRKLHLRQLLSANRRVLEADPQGAPMVRSEVLAFSPSAVALERAQATGFSIARERPLGGLDARIVVLRSPEKVTTRRALERLRALDPEGVYDFNHIYTESGDISAAADTVNRPGNREERALRAGMVDGGVDTAHIVFQNVTVHQHGCGEQPVPSVHGTAVASLIAAREIYAADIYCNRPTGGAMDDIADGIAWIAEQHVPVINVSLVGPRNLMLERIVRLAGAKGYLIVAAVGNDGPAAPPLYPASYPGVIGVTAVDLKQHVLLESCRGPQVYFAAQGAQMNAAVSGQAYAPVRGTSFAAPIVTGLLAAKLTEPGKSAADAVLAELARTAVDLGAPGRDDVYGNGLVGGISEGFKQ